MSKFNSLRYSGLALKLPRFVAASFTAIFSLTQIFTAIPTYADEIPLESKPAVNRFDTTGAIYIDPITQDAAWADAKLNPWLMNFASVEEAASLLYNATHYEEILLSRPIRFSKLHGAIRFISENADEQLLAGMLKHTNPIVRCYAVEGLVLRHKKQAPIGQTVANRVAALLKDSESFETNDKTDPKAMTVGECVAKYGVSILPEDVIDDIVLNNTHPQILQELLMTHTFDERHYQRIKSLYSTGNLKAYVALAKYQKEQDLVIIEKALAEDLAIGFTGIKHFPHPRFFELVISKIESDYGKREHIYEFFYALSALLAYEEALVLPKIKQLLNIHRNHTQKNALFFLSLKRAFDENMALFPAHLELKYWLFEDHGFITLDIFNELAENIPEATATTAQKWLLKASDNKQFYFVYGRFLTHIAQFYPDVLPTLISDSISRNTYPSFSSLKPFLLNYPAKTIEETLIQRLVTTTDPKTLVQIIEIIEKVYPHRLDTSLLIQSPLLKTKWSKWQKKHCQNLINHHIEKHTIRAMLQTQCVK